MPRRRPAVLIEVPFHLGLEGISVGAGPRALIEAGADRILSCRGIPATVEHIRLRDADCKDTDAIVDVNRQIAAAVREAIEQEALPVVLAGNCNSCWGTLAGLQPAITGIVWLDAHPDFHTPATSVSGYLDGMALAAAVGHCHHDLAVRCGLITPVAEANVCLLATRDVDPGERDRLAASLISERLPEQVEAVYLHLDLDFLDAAECPGVNFRAPGGMPLNDASRLVEHIAQSTPLRAAAITNFNPQLDRDGLTVHAAARLLEAIARVT